MKEQDEAYKIRRAYREGLLEGMWTTYRILMKEISKVEDKLHKDYPETRGTDPGY
jgi:hypothetical protein